MKMVVTLDVDVDELDEDEITSEMKDGIKEYFEGLDGLDVSDEHDVEFTSGEVSGAVYVTINEIEVTFP